MRTDRFLLLYLHSTIFSDYFLEWLKKSLQICCDFNSFSLDVVDELLQDYPSDIQRIV
jgi:hypothetical protein